MIARAQKSSVRQFAVPSPTGSPSIRWPTRISHSIGSFLIANARYCRANSISSAHRRSLFSSDRRLRDSDALPLLTETRMSRTVDTQYLARRVRACRTAAVKVSDSCARIAHAAMAEAYQRRVDDADHAAEASRPLTAVGQTSVGLRRSQFMFPKSPDSLDRELKGVKGVTPTLQSSQQTTRCSDPR